MKTQILARLGMLESELRAVRELGQALPDHWKAYCGIELILPRQEAREIDMLIVADDRVIVAEIKEWNGDSIVSDRKSWFTSRRNSVSGPKRHGVNQVTTTWKMLLNRIKEKTNGRHLFIDKCVIQAGTASISSLPEEEQEFVFYLEDMKTVGCKEIFTKFFKFQPNLARNRITRDQFIQDLDRLLTNPNFAQGKKIRVAGFTADEQPILSGPAYGFWEYRGLKDEDSTKVIALMRRWRFSSECLSSLIVTEKERDKILFNESRIQRIQRDSFSEYTFNTLHNAYTPDEACDDAFEIYEIPKKYARVSSLASSQLPLKIDDALLILKNIYSEIQTFHAAGFIIGDLTTSSFWYSPNFCIKISNLYHSYLEREKNSEDILVPSNATCICLQHEDLLGDWSDKPKNFSMSTDIVLASEIARKIILKIDRPGAEEIGPTSDHTKIMRALDKWMSLHRENERESQRFHSIDQALQSLVEISKKRVGEETSPIDQFVTEANIWRKFQISRTESIAGGCTRIYTTDNKIIDTWDDVVAEKDSSSNLKLARFLHNINAFRGLDISALQLPIEIGFCKSINTVYVVYDKDAAQENASCETRGFEHIANIDDSKSFIIDLLETIIKLHQLNISFGTLEYNMVYAYKHDERIRCKIVAPFRYESTTREEYGHLYDNSDDDLISDKRADLLLCMDIAKQLISNYENTKDLIEKADEIAKDCQSDVSALKMYIKDLSDHGSSLLEQDKNILIPAINRIDNQRITSDDGIIYCEMSTDGERVYISGNTEVATVRLDTLNMLAVVIKVARLSHLDYLQKKRRCRSINCGDIILANQDDFTSGQRAFELFEQNLRIGTQDSEALDITENKRDLSKQSTSGNVAARNLWEALMNAEEKLLPRFKVLKEIRLARNSVQELEVQDLSIEDGDESVFTISGINEVEVQSKGEWISIGRLYSKTTDTLSIMPNLYRDGWTIRPGQEVRVDNILNRSSRQKRQAALDDVLEGKSVISGIHNYFLGNSATSAERFGAISSATHIESTPANLNDSQQKAFNGVMESRGPISIIQGPPGTGKTFFIASLIGSILKNNPSSRILISGQSHESVNNCIEKTLAINPCLESVLKVVRLGDETQLSEVLLKYSEDEIQDYYLNSFESEFNYRIRQAIKRLPVPGEAVKEIIEVSRLLQEIQNCKASQGRLDLKQLNKGELTKRIDRMVQVVQMIICGNNDDPSSGDLEAVANLDKNSAKQILVNAIAEKYELHDIQAVHKAFNIVSISFEWCQSLRVSRKAFQEHLTKTRNLVCGTCVGIARSHYDMGESIFDWVIVDEAGRASFTELCIPMRYGKKVILVGDEKQLPPQIDNEIIRYLESEQRIYSREEIKKSDFERIINTDYGKENTYQLREQYRMSGSIGDLCSSVFYDNSLVNKAKKLQPGNIIEYQGNKFSGLTWIDTSCLGELSYEEKGDTTSFINRAEAGIVIDLIVYLQQHELHRDTTIGAICMYKDQVRLIEESINKIPGCRMLIKDGRLEIGTVDSFQGRERDIIILSVVRSNKENAAGFLKASSRINVAVSRARDHLLIIGNSKTAISQPPDSAICRVYSYIQSNSTLDGCNLVKSISMNVREEEVWS